jgi:hypothetical protein
MLEMEDTLQIAKLSIFLTAAANRGWTYYYLYIILVGPCSMD